MPWAAPRFEACGAISEYLACAEGTLVCEDRFFLYSGISKKLLKLEREVFLSGLVKAFMLPADNCNLCDDCVSSREDCKQPKLSRPPPEAMAVDVFSTARKAGYPIEVLSDYNQAMNRYAFLLVR